MLTIPESVIDLVEDGIEVERQDYESPIQRILRKPEPEVSKIIAKQEVVSIEHRLMAPGSNLGLPEIRIFRLKDKDTLPIEFETENPDKILIDGETVVYVFRIRPWLRRVH